MQLLDFCWLSAAHFDPPHLWKILIYTNAQQLLRTSTKPDSAWPTLTNKISHVQIAVCKRCHLARTYMLTFFSSENLMSLVSLQIFLRKFLTVPTFRWAFKNPVVWGTVASIDKINKENVAVGLNSVLWRQTVQLFCIFSNVTCVQVGR